MCCCSATSKVLQYTFVVGLFCMIGTDGWHNIRNASLSSTIVCLFYSFSLPCQANASSASQSLHPFPSPNPSSYSPLAPRAQTNTANQPPTPLCSPAVSQNRVLNERDDDNNDDNSSIVSSVTEFPGRAAVGFHVDGEREQESMRQGERIGAICGGGGSLRGYETARGRRERIRGSAAVGLEETIPVERQMASKVREVLFSLRLLLTWFTVGCKSASEISVMFTTSLYQIPTCGISGPP